MAGRRPRASSPSAEELVRDFPSQCSTATPLEADPPARSALARAMRVYGSRGDCVVLQLTLAGTDVYLLDWQIDDEAGIELFTTDGARFASSAWSVHSIGEEDLRPETISWSLGATSDAFDRYSSP